ncbi:hypothetical protein FMM75_20750 [Lachnospiraceae bacterium MD335]|nr:hypothetical protein [Lachnospiraceae bacterium MD335]
MERRNFSQILEEAQIDIRREYDRLYSSFYLQKTFDQYGNNWSLSEHCQMNFLNIPFRGTCLTLDDFDDVHNTHFEKVPSQFDLNYLVLFCEYTYNFLIYLNPINIFGNFLVNNPHQIYLQQIYKVIEEIGYMYSANKKGITIFVPKSQEAISVSEIIDPELSYKVIEYNHHLLQGNIEGKKAILLLLADKIESKRTELKNINKTMETNIFMLFNNMNIRHDNCSKESPHYIEYVANMPKKQLEEWYDEIYQLSLLAFLELDNIERNRKISDLKDLIGKGKSDGQ